MDAAVTETPSPTRTDRKKKHKEANHQARAAKKEEILLERMNETQYVLSNGLRQVLPYYAEHRVCAKERWFGLSLSELFQSHLGYSSEYLDKALARGLILINDAIPPREYCIRRDDVIRHNAHRHEPPVLDYSIHIVADTKDILAISKPPSIPIHPTGAFRHNTVLGLLSKEHGYTKHLYPLHRIDRLTSGLLLIGRHPSVVRSVSPRIEQGSVGKKYVARVRGDFPQDPITVDEPIGPWPGMRVLHRTTQIGGKSATTTFQRLRGFSDNTSLILCTLKTGRTHQIRVHLKHIGFPIANDPAYGPNSPSFDFVPTDDTPFACGEDDLDSTTASTTKPTNTTSDTIATTTTPTTTEITTNIAENTPTEKPPNYGTYDDICEFCTNKRTFMATHQLIWLHAFQYESDDWKFEAPLPTWATEL